MKILFLLLSLTIIKANAQCDACINGTCQTKTEIFEGFSITSQVAIDRGLKTLYFYGTHPDHGRGTFAYSLVDGPKKINTKYTFSLAVDQKTHDVYMCGNRVLDNAIEEDYYMISPNIFKYNSKTNRTEFFVMSNKIIERMQFTDKLYTSGTDTRAIHFYVNGTSDYIDQLLMSKFSYFIVDKLGDIYYQNDYYISYRYKKNAYQSTLFSLLSLFVTTDKDFNAYFYRPITMDLCKLNYEKDELISVGAFYKARVREVLFDGDNYVIYNNVSDGKWYHLTPNELRCRLLVEDRGRYSRKFVDVIETNKTSSS